MQGMTTRDAFDWAMALGYIPCKYYAKPIPPLVKPQLVDLVRKFILAVWVKYMSTMVRFNMLRLRVTVSSFLIRRVRCSVVAGKATTNIQVLHANP